MGQDRSGSWRARLAPPADLLATGPGSPRGAAAVMCLRDRGDNKGVVAETAQRRLVRNYRSQGEARGLESVMEMKQNCFLPESTKIAALKIIPSERGSTAFIHPPPSPPSAAAISQFGANRWPDLKSFGSKQLAPCGQGLLSARASTLGARARPGHQPGGLPACPDPPDADQRPPHIRHKSALVLGARGRPPVELGRGEPEGLRTSDHRCLPTLSS